MLVSVADDQAMRAYLLSFVLLAAMLVDDSQDEARVSVHRRSRAGAFR
jgi:hypothetical protein